MKLALKIIAITGITVGVGAIAVEVYRIVSTLRAGLRQLNACDDYDCNLCPNEGLCGLCDKK